MSSVDLPHRLFLEEKMAIHVVTGVRGVGKTAVCTAMVNEFRGMQHVAFGDVIHQCASEVLGRDILRAETQESINREPEIRSKVYDRVRKNLDAMLTNGEILLETSGIVFNGGIFLRIAGHRFWEDLMPQHVVLLVAEPGVILQRFTLDTKNRGAAASAGLIRRSQELLVMWASGYAIARQIPMTLIQADESLGDIVEAMQRSICLSEQERGLHASFNGGSV